jgi:predicted nucleic acid-binding protein
VSLVALDTSVAIPLLVQTHTEHSRVVRWLSGRPVALAGHAAIETYSVLTRLPGDLRLSPADAARLMAARFSAPLLLTAAKTAKLPDALARLGVAGGAVHDAVVALAAAQHGAELATRDLRAVATYELVGARAVTLA